MSFITQSCPLPISRSPFLHRPLLPRLSEPHNPSALHPFFPPPPPPPTSSIHSHRANSAFEMHVPSCPFSCSQTSSLLGCSPNLTEPRPCVMWPSCPPHLWAPRGPLGGPLRSRMPSSGSSPAPARPLPTAGPWHALSGSSVCLVGCLGDSCAPCPPSLRCPKHPS